MKVAIYGRKFNEASVIYVQQLIDTLTENQVEIIIYSAFHAYLVPRVKFQKNVRGRTPYPHLEGRGGARAPKHSNLPTHP